MYPTLNVNKFDFVQNVTKKSLKSFNSGEMLNFRHRLHDRKSLFMETEDNDSFSSYSNQYSSRSVANQSCIVYNKSKKPKLINFKNHSSTDNFFESFESCDKIKTEKFTSSFKKQESTFTLRKSQSINIQI